jgi:hypothetical protein
MSIIARTHPPVNPSPEGPFPDHDLDRMPYTRADRDWAAVALNEDAADFEVIEADEHDWPGTSDEFNRWLDSIAPTEGELEHRDRTDAFLGHDA